MASHLTPRAGDQADPLDDALLRELADLDPQRGAGPTPEQWARSRAHLRDLMASPASPTDVQEDLRASTRVASRPTAPPASPASPAPRGRRRLVLGLSAAAAAVVVSGAGVVLPSASTIAYAGSWSAVPSSAGATAGLEQARECATRWQEQPAGGITASDVLIAERRGDSTVTVVRKDDGAVLCEAIDSTTPTGWEALAPTRSTGTDDVTVESQGSSGTWPLTRSTIAGQVGAGVTGIEVLAGSTTISASVSGGRWVAWWPGDEGGEVGAVEVVIHTAGGVRTVASSALVR